MTAVAINMANGKPTLIINVYNPINTDNIKLLRNHLRQHMRQHEYGAAIIAGDFNLHHPLWNPQSYHNTDPQAEELIEMMMENNLDLLLPSGTVTFPRAKTTSSCRGE